jgi:hypothetical protein
MTANNTFAKYVNKCEHCRYLGREPATKEEPSYDYYFCVETGDLIARYGNQDDQKFVGLQTAWRIRLTNKSHPLVKALVRAQAQGYIDEDGNATGKGLQFQTPPKVIVGKKTATQYSQVFPEDPGEEPTFVVIQSVANRRPESAKRAVNQLLKVHRKVADLRESQSNKVPVSQYNEDLRDALEMPDHYDRMIALVWHQNPSCRSQGWAISAVNVAIQSALKGNKASQNMVYAELNMKTGKVKLLLEPSNGPCIKMGEMVRKAQMSAEIVLEN